MVFSLVLVVSVKLGIKFKCKNLGVHPKLSQVFKVIVSDNSDNRYTPWLVSSTANDIYDAIKF